MNWVLIPCLVQLRTEFNMIAPTRGKASDGSIGDTAHQQEVSDHNADEVGKVPIRDADSVNEVHAIDVDKDLKVSGLTMEKVVQFLLARCRSGAEKRLRYVIYNRRIWKASNGWKQETYTGPSAHTEHAHFSASYDSKLEASKASWELEELIMPTADEIATAVIKKIRATYPVLSDGDRQAIASEVWDHTEPNPFDDGETERRMGGDMRMMEFRASDRAAGSVTRENDAIDKLMKMQTRIDSLESKLDQLIALHNQS